MVNMPGTLREKFYFTVPDDAVADNTTRPSKRVSLTYDRHINVSSTAIPDERWVRQRIQIDCYRPSISAFYYWLAEPTVVSEL